ncbi:restriction endonuclease subunit S [Campylobacter devanensis]|uniref:restriction endonuclease subunit S n=1 Tax=Campylobacter devanensis TaxID=3161138 RepID=UPI000A3493A5|nr:MULTISPECIES: restriction endonuclease subunit S [unclassified Campylobacter]
MSKLDELINKLCPNGVEFKKIGKVSNFVQGFAFKNNTFKENGIGLVRTTNIQDKSISEDNMVYIKPDEYKENLSKYIIKKDRIIIGMSGTIKVGINNSDKNYYLNQRVGMFIANEEIINNKYLFYVLDNSIPNLYNLVSGSSVKNLSSNVLNDFEIPVPPLEVQCEIVRILDNFTLLSAELSAELSARQKQYNFYRENLLTNDFEKNVKLKDLCDIKGRIGFRGYTRNDLVEEGQGAISFSPGNIINETINYNNCTYISWKKYEESPEIMINNGDIILCKTGSTLGKVAMVKNLPEKATLNPQLVVLKNLKCNSTYLKYIIGGYDFQYAMQAKKGLGSVPNISQKDIGNIEIRLHSPENQEKIASILDRFDKLCNDISEGLPAEIEARKKQYEYYRDKLLTFKELK